MPENTEFEQQVLNAVADWTDEEVQLAFGFTRPNKEN